MIGDPLRRPLYAVALTRDGAALAARLAEAFPGTRALAPARFAGAPGEGPVEGFSEPVARLVARLWPEAGGFFLIMAAGIAVRCLAPLIRDKARDPAVVVLDAAGRFAVPILAGHLGGANDLAREVGRRLGAAPVITTATDAAGRPAVEVWARDRGFRVEGRRGVIRVNGAWANGEPVAAFVDPALGGARLVATLAPHLARVVASEDEARAFEGALVAVTHRQTRWKPTVVLRPACLALGVGCRRGADPEAVRAGVLGALAAAGLSPRAAAVVASVDAKADEPALRELAGSLEVPFRTFPPAVLAAIAVPTPSRRVAAAVGTPSVSEAAALAAGGSELVLPKVKGQAWTLAVALRVPPAEDAEGGSGVGG